MSILDDHRGPWRSDELAGLPDDHRYEVVDVLVAPHRLERRAYAQPVRPSGEVPAPWGAVHLDLSSLRD